MTARPQKDPIFNPSLPAVVITGLRWHRDPKQGLLAFNVAGRARRLTFIPGDTSERT